MEKECEEAVVFRAHVIFEVFLQSSTASLQQVARLKPGREFLLLVAFLLHLTIRVVCVCVSSLSYSLLSTWLREVQCVQSSRFSALIQLGEGNEDMQNAILAWFYFVITSLFEAPLVLARQSGGNVPPSRTINQVRGEAAQLSQSSTNLSVVLMGGNGFDGNAADAAAAQLLSPDAGD